MSLPTSQQRALDRIEKTLADDHPSLGPLFGIFTRLVGHEAMPLTERVTARRWRIRPAVAALVGLALAAVALFAFGLTLPTPRACPGTLAALAAHTQSVPTGRLPACATPQNRHNSP